MVASRHERHMYAYDPEQVPVRARCMKIVYLVRHGESEANARAQPVYTGPASPLTEIGRTQAERIAERASHLTFEVLIASSWTRAQETAEAIARKTGKHIVISDLFTEIRAPLSCAGMTIDDPAFAQKMRRWNDSVFKGGERVEDGENFEDLMRRTRSALAYLDERPEERMLIATHGLFLRLLMAYVMFGDDLTPQLFRKFASATKTDNTGVTVLTKEAMRLHETDSSERWRLRVFNDHSHLG